MGSDRSTALRNALPTSAALVEQLVSGMNQARVHELSHPRVATHLAAAQGCLQRIGRELGDPRIDIRVEGERLSLDGCLEMARTAATTRLSHLIRARGAIGLRLSSAIETPDFAGLFRVLMSPPDGTSVFAINRALASSTHEHVELLAPAGSNDAETQDPAAPVGDAAEGPRRIPPPPSREPTLVQVAREALTTAAAGRAIQLTTVAREVATFAERAAERGGVAMDLSTRGHGDPDGAWHAARTCALVIEVGKTLTEEPDVLVRLAVAALLHDVGEAFLPLETRNAGADPDPELRARWQRHTELGADYLLGLPGFDPLCVSVALGHHRNQVGGGHPRMHHDHVQSPFVQLVRIADVYETLTAPDRHRDPLAPSHAFRAMVSARGELSTPVLRRFIEALGLWPIGSLVRLTTGEIARVVRRGADLENPVVVVVATPQGRALPAEARRTVDLSSPTAGAPRLASRA